MNRSKQKGTAMETLVTNYLRQEWDAHIHRRALTGSADQGDIGGFELGPNGKELAIEVKNCAKLALAEWVGEAQAEAINAGAVAGIVVHKRKGKGQPEDQYVTMTLGDFVTILRTLQWENTRGKQSS